MTLISLFYLRVMILLYTYVRLSLAIKFPFQPKQKIKFTKLNPTIDITIVPLHKQR